MVKSRRVSKLYSLIALVFEAIFFVATRIEIKNVAWRSDEVLLVTEEVEKSFLIQQNLVYIR